MMPFMDGFQMTEKIKMELKTSHIPILILTAKTEDESF
jgi:CheY-like chemotaxis protein